MRLLFAVLASLLILAAPAHAAGPELGIADDRLLLAGGPEADKAVLEWQQNGIQNVRIYALWSRIAPNSPTGTYEWAQLDHAIDRVTAAGIKPILTVTGPGPLWVSRRSERGEPRYDPDPKLFGEFAGMVAARYGARVDRYIVWNEPNLAGWIRPQAACFGKVCNSVAPHLYRDLVAASYPAIHAADSNAQVLIGTMSSRGSKLSNENSNHRPLAFLRALGCVDAKFKKLSSGRCRNFKPAPADGFAFHPHGVLAAPEKVFPAQDDVSIASLSRLTSALDKLSNARRIKGTKRKLDLYLDEFGYQTNPPDKFTGITLTQQDQWLQRAAYQAWRNPRVKLFAQYLWVDEPRSLNNETGGWQSGVRFTDGRAKPSLKHFAMPFALDAARGRLWGQVRTRETRTVTVQRRLAGASSWRTIGTRRTDSQGYWSWTTRLTVGASYRFQAAGATSAALKRR
ncbi:cellulase family glycosylhydrolase [Solirubrobacter sp. CPCC 204708]|uniref:Cellulase family glycosylhydrolase n=1 Tax=Solirubrobacter deserti TaxID=2282478 RepID=A0ABT4RU97_9ACTN|nr:cellulase family glycosylhydrolase [Solirubrobacter deserti]MBE2316464.1 cellulase family glycosylhydrolase [Solirubrobacter deserti]MDA0142154.1 cellulase family glycosylhydrolase [Solirubrobacter deserti]